MNTTIALLILLAIVALAVLVHAFAWGALTLFSEVAKQFPLRVAGSKIWKRSASVGLGLSERYPLASRLFWKRINPHEVTGLPLSLIAAAAFYAAALFSGLTEDILESQGTIRVDNLVHAFFQTWRLQPLTSIFTWITELGSGPAVVAAVIIATGFLWSQRRFWIVAPMWMTCVGAVASTSIGKFVIGRHRPPNELDIIAMTPSFPSGHATAAMAVYGFLAYAIARHLPRRRDRFEIAYWTGVLIALIGCSRVYLGVHYLTDVIGGFLVGGFWLLAGFAVAELNTPRETPKQ